MVDRRLTQDGPPGGVEPENKNGGRRAYRAACGRLCEGLTGWWRADRAACGRQGGKQDCTARQGAGALMCTLVTPSSLSQYALMTAQRPLCALGA